MRYFIYPTQDTTLYEKHRRRNTGIDQILELEKNVPNVPDIDGIYWDSTYNSRILMKFDVPYINRLIQAGTISTSAKYYLTVKATEARELPIEYTLNVHPLARPWVNGQGHFNDYPEITTGASWEYTDGYFFNTGKRWYSGSLENTVTGSFTTQQGGGLWYTAPVCSQSLDYVTIPDLRIDITTIVREWISGSIPNYGLIIKHTDELENNSTFVGSLKFFGKDSHTVYLPRIEAAWDDSVLSGTGSLDEVSTSFTVHLTNIKKTYRTISKEEFRIIARELDPPKTYSTSSRFLQVKRLPTSSYYAVQDYTTVDYVIPFDVESTKLSVDDQGNYFRLDMNALLPERYYKIVIKTIQKGGKVEQVFDDGYFFKVMR